MSLRHKLLLMFSITVTVAVAAVGWTVSLRVRRVFDQLDQEQTQVFARQFRREFQHRADDVSAALDRMAAGERLTHLAFDLSHEGEAAFYLNEAGTLAQEYQLSYLEITGADGKIISSAQWPARFGYPDPAFAAAGRPPFLKEEAMPDGSSQTGLFAVRSVRSLESGGDVSLYLIGGTKLDRDFLADLPVPAGSHVYLYRNSSADFDSRNLSGTSDEEMDASKYRPLIDGARKSGADSSGIVYISPRREDSVNATAIPLKGEDGNVLAVLLLANSRRGMVEVQRHIRAIAFGVAGIGILFAIGASLWIAARVSRPIEQLALATGEVAQGRWETHVTVHAKDEVGALAESFNRMTSQLVEQRDQLVQSERVAAWRELARRLAHELKNPLFPLQLTVENMVRARHLPAAEFDEVFAERHGNPSVGDRQPEADHCEVQRFFKDAEAPGGEAGRPGSRTTGVASLRRRTVRASSADSIAQRDKRVAVGNIRGSGTAASRNLQLGAKCHRRYARGRRVAGVCSAQGRLRTNPHLRYRRRSDCGGMRAALYTLLHYEGIWHRTWPCHRTVGGR